MSEERRKRQRQRDSSTESDGKGKRIALYAVIIVLFAGAYYAGWYHKNHKYDTFAKCLASHQAKMYGLYWCPHCQDQKAMFGESFPNVPYVECAIKGSSELAPACKLAGVKLFPSWQFGSDAPKEGILSLEVLSDKTGCSLP